MAPPYIVDVKTNIYGAYVSDVLNITDKLMALAALRYDYFDNKGGLEYSPVEPYAQKGFSPKFGLVYQPIKDQVSIFANYQNSFTNKGAYRAMVNGSLTTAIAKLERANQIEGGVKLDAFNGKLSSTISYYNIKVENVLRADPSNPANAQIQDGTQLSKGVEVDIMANPVNGLNINAGFAYNDSKYTEADADVINRRPATAMSPYLANFFISYRFTNNALNGLGFGFGGNYASSNKIVNSVSMGVYTLPSYTVLNASAFYDLKRIRFSAKVDNLTDEKYWIGYTTQNPQRLRTYAGSITYKF
ncbi:Ferrichrome-iron receptor precursor [compost metagenome]